ncbi:hypothetical protein F2Q68_00041446, partial [Brassica cretica]
EMEMEFKELKEAIDQVELVDAHAHNIVSLDSSFPFIGTFSEATGDALSFAPHSLSFKEDAVNEIEPGEFAAAADENGESEDVRGAVAS